MKEFSEFREELKTTIFKDDLLDRMPFTEALYNLINKEEPVLQDNKSLVVAIDAPWGTGKTYFLDLFEKTLDRVNKDEENPSVIVRYNAWENDDFDDPLLSILYCLVKKQMQRKDIKSDLAKQGINIIENIAVPVILNMIKEKTGFDAQKAFEIAKGALDVEHSKSFEKYEEAMNKKKAFRDSMKTLSKKIK